VGRNGGFNSGLQQRTLAVSVSFYVTILMVVHLERMNTQGLESTGPWTSAICCYLGPQG
jgi:hypothetical protein